MKMQSGKQSLAAAASFLMLSTVCIAALPDRLVFAAADIPSRLGCGEKGQYAACMSNEAWYRRAEDAAICQHGAISVAPCGVSGWVQAHPADAHCLTVRPEESFPDNVKEVPFMDEERWAQESARIRLRSGWNDAKGSAIRVAMGWRCDCVVGIGPADATSKGLSREVKGLLYHSAPPP